MYYDGVIYSGAGKVLEALRACLLNEGWTFLGAIATNYEVYHSTGDSGLENIIIAIDNTDLYTLTLKAATAYNPTTKVLSNATDPRYIDWFNIFAKAYWFFVKKDFFIIVLKTQNELEPYAFSYCGLLNRYDPTAPYCIVCSGAPGPDEPPIGIAHGNNFTGQGFQLLQDHTGNHNRTMDATSLNANFGAAQLPNIVDGNFIIFPILIGKTDTEIHGELRAVYSIQNASIASEDIFTINNSEYICFIIYTYKCAIQKIS